MKVIEYANGETQLRFYKNGMYKKPTKSDFEVEQTKAENDLKRTPFDNKIASEVDEFTSEDELKARAEKCLQSNLNRAKNEVYSIARANTWEWFITFTCASEKVNRYDFDDCSKMVRKWINNLKNRYAPDMKYILVPERHEDGAWHFHGLIANLGSIPIEKAVNNKKDSPYYGQNLRTAYPDGDYIYNIGNYKIGWNTVTRIKDAQRASNYISKYVTKSLVEATRGKKRYYASQNLEKAKIGLYTFENMTEAIEQLSGKKNVTHTSTVNVTNGGYVNTVTYIELR